MRYIIILIFLSSFNAFANEYRLSWYPKDKYFDTIQTPENNKFSLINTEGVWEDNKGSFGIMKCLLSLFTDEKQNTNLNGFCEANDNNDSKSKFWVTLKRSSLETTGVGEMTYVSGTGIYKRVVGMSCKYAVKFLGDYGVIKQKCSEDFSIKLNKE